MQPLNLDQLTHGKDGDKYFYLYGKDLQEGVSGFGNTYAAAANDFVLNSNFTIPEVNGKCKVLYEGNQSVATVISIEGGSYTARIDGIGAIVSNLIIWQPY
jgi:hypothetical protein